MHVVRVVMLGLAAIALSASTVFAADATGVWRGEVKLPTGQVLPFIARLTQAGAKITGKLDGIGGAPDVDVIDGKVEKDVVSFSGVRQINNAPVKFNYTATFTDDNTLEFKILREDGSGAALASTAKRSAN